MRFGFDSSPADVSPPFNVWASDDDGPYRWKKKRALVLAYLAVIDGATFHVWIQRNENGPAGDKNGRKMLENRVV